MALLVGELYALLKLEKMAFMKGLKEAEAAAAAGGKSITQSLASVGKIVAVGLGVAAIAAVAIGVESVQAATKFRYAMSMIQTEAGASAFEVKQLSAAVLKIATSVGTGPEELAKGLYHIESAGIRGSRALDMLKTAALGAKMGGADLENVANALIATMNSGIGGVTGMSQAMGALTGIVGNGNMRMNELSLAMSTGILSVAKQFGISMESVGAALATMTDQGVPAVDAATKIKSALFNLASPIGATVKAFASIGLSTSDLAVEMRSPRGLVGALKMLRDHMNDAGLDAIQQSQVLANAFGKRAGPAVFTLLNSLTMVENKEKAIGKAATHFSQNVAVLMDTTKFKADQLGAAFEVVAVQIGDALLPVAETVLAAFTDMLQSKELQQAFSIIGQGAQMLGQALGVIGTVAGAVIGFFDSIGMTGPIVAAVITALAVALGVFLVGAIAGVVAAAAPFIAIALAIGASWTVLEKVLEHFGASIPGVIGNAFGLIISIAKGVVGTLLNIVGTMVGILASFPNPLQDQAKEWKKSLDDMRRSVDMWGTDTAGAVKDAVQGIAKDIGDILGVHVPQTVSDGMSKTIGNIKDALTGGRYAIKNGVLVMLEETQTVLPEAADPLVAAMGETGDDMGAALFDEFGNALVAHEPAATGKALSLIQQFGVTLRGVVEAVGTAAGSEAMGAMAKGIADAEAKPKDAFDAMIEMMKTELSPAKEAARLIGELTSKKLAQGLKDGRPGVRASAETALAAIIERLAQMEPTAKTIGSKGMHALQLGMKSKNKEIRRAATEIYNSVIHPISRVQNYTFNYGANAMKNFISGLESQQHHLNQVLSRLAGSASDYLKTSSPSKLGPMSIGGGPEGWGKNAGLLFANGLGMSLPNVAMALSNNLGAPMLGRPSTMYGGSFGASDPSSSGRSLGAPRGDVHNHYEVKVTGFVKARDPFEISKAMRRVSSVRRGDEQERWLR